MKLFHRTTMEVATAILAEGFRDGEGRYMTTQTHRGVWLSDEPIDFTDGIPADWIAVLTVDLPSEAVEPYEWIEELSRRREFLVPASVVNAGPKPTLTIDEL